ncbi:MAG: alcohol dehydrogenase catalytic domain-containing protein [Rhodoglobus sp.]
MTGSMTAAVYYGPGDVRIERRPIPVPAPGEVLVRVLRSGMCGTDASEWKSGPKIFPVGGTPHATSGHSGPMILGHEFVGEIVDAGDSGFAEGDRVASGAGISCGTCVRCLEGRTNLCLNYVTLGLNRDGGMAEYVAVPVSTLEPIPADLNIDYAGLAQPLAVGLHAARRSGAKDGDQIVIIGSGAIGTFVLAALVSLVDATITVVDFAGPRLDRARRLGAHHTVAAGEDAAEQVRAIVGAGADVVIEASGAPGQLDVALHFTRRGGLLLQVGLPALPQPLDVHHLVMNEITIESTLAHVCKDDLAPALAILGSTELAELLAESTHPLNEISDQLELLATGQIQGKVLFDPTLG